MATTPPPEYPNRTQTQHSTPRAVDVANIYSGNNSFQKLSFFLEKAFIGQTSKASLD